MASKGALTDKAPLAQAAAAGRSVSADVQTITMERALRQATIAASTADAAQPAPAPGLPQGNRFGCDIRSTRPGQAHV